MTRRGVCRAEGTLRPTAVPGFRADATVRLDQMAADIRILKEPDD